MFIHCKGGLGRTGVVAACVVRALAVKLLPGSVQNFMADAWLRVLPKHETVVANLSDQERLCLEDKFCKFAPISDSALALFYRDTTINGLCDRHSYAQCRPWVTRAAVTGALMSLDVRARFPVASGIPYDPKDPGDQSTMVMTHTAVVGDAARKALVADICAFVNGRYPAVDVERVFVHLDAPGRGGEDFTRYC
jgi:hypothetical protein